MSTDASREAFEAWLAGHDPRSFCQNAYWEHDYKWKAWQASRKQALEEAIQAAQPEDTYLDAWFDAKADSVRKIEALK